MEADWLIYRRCSCVLVARAASASSCNASRGFVIKEVEEAEAEAALMDADDGDCRIFSSNPEAFGVVGVAGMEEPNDLWDIVSISSN